MASWLGDGGRGTGRGLWGPHPIFWLPEENGAWADMTCFEPAPHDPELLVTSYLFFAADVPGRGPPGDGGNGVSRGFAGQSDLFLQLHGGLVLHVGDFGFC